MSYSITIDARDPARLARFWATALPGYEVRAYEAAEIERLATLGLTPETDVSVAVDGDGPTLWFQKTDGATPPRNRVHLDLSYGPRTSEASRLVAAASVHEQRTNHIVMHDPEGNQFCLFDP